MKPNRERLAADSYEEMASLGGSFDSDDITDYYLTPFDLGYGPFVRFDHEFVGRAALEAIADRPWRAKMTLVWNGEDIGRALGSIFGVGETAKYIDLPLTNYATLPFDTAARGSRIVGVSTYTGYTWNERALVSLASVDVASSESGTEVRVVWGEAGGGSSKRTVEPHVQTEIRARVAPAAWPSLPVWPTARRRNPVPPAMSRYGSCCCE